MHVTHAKGGVYATEMRDMDTSAVHPTNVFKQSPVVH